jgi:uncharacterized protein
LTECDGPLPEEAVRGLACFNAGQYFEAHEHLETAWRAETAPIRELYRGVLQVGVAYYHIQRGNYSGALKLFQHCREWLAPFPDVCRGIDLAHLRQSVNQAEAELLRLGPERIAEFNPALFRKIEISTQSD